MHMQHAKRSAAQASTCKANKFQYTGGQPF